MKYEQVYPVSLASEVIAERWTPLILREIVLFDRHHFSEIQHGVGRISQSLLSARLRTLEEAGVIERHPNRAGRGWEYHPTPAGRELETVLNELGIWAQHWIDLRREDCDPAYLMQTVHAGRSRLSDAIESVRSGWMAGRISCARFHPGSGRRAS